MRSLVFLLAAFSSAASADLRYQMRCEVLQLGEVTKEDPALQKVLDECQGEVLTNGKYYLFQTKSAIVRTDLQTQETIYIDPKTKSWSKGVEAASETALGRQLQDLKDRGMKLNVETKAIPTSRKIEGYTAKGTAIRFQIEMPMEGVRNPQGEPVIIGTTTNMEIWASNPIAGLAAGEGTKSPLEMQIAPLLNGLPDHGAAVRKAIPPGSLCLEMKIQTKITGMDQLLPPGIDAAPPAGMNMIVKATQITSGPLPAKLFEIPAGYKEVE
ncbi:hypothetical protein [Bryobacter aggregatus]|uniref:hypothetical protein n=1 Tax=Bryobacter aggregatus TaxID=360054 RepID=UPI0012BB1241|nr:hypothetical protein [Bryobacter aggregatus]